MADLKDDIEKYLKGELTPSEMHALEKKALGDPFLGEALEGAGQITPQHLDADLESLQASLQTRVKGKAGKVISLWVWPARIAAGLLLVAISTFIIIRETKDQPSKDLAVRDEVNPPSSEKGEQKETVATDSVEIVDKNLLSLAKPEEAKSKSPTPVIADQQKDEGEVSSAAQPVQEEKPQLTEEPKTDEVHAAAEIIVKEKIAQAVPPETLSQGALKKSEARRDNTREAGADRKGAAGAQAERSALDAPVNSRIIKGQVVSVDGSELPGVNVMIKGTNIGTVTDALGNYQISVDQQHSNLVFSFIGFMGTELEVGQGDQLDVRLSEDISQLSEVVVVGYGADVNLDDNLSSNLELATPAGGRKAFKQYLEKNLRYPEQALENKVEGRVTIQFTVESSGQLTDFNVLRGIGDGCDEEVIRLVKQGPKWTPTKRNENSLRDKVKVRMRFELPKK